MLAALGIIALGVLCPGLLAVDRAVDRRPRHHHKHEPEFEFEQHRLPFDTVLPFRFGQTNTFALQSFYYYTPYHTFVIVFDCFCNGDVFYIYDNGKFVTSTDGVDCTSENTVSDCSYYGPDPYYCLEAGFCRNNDTQGALEPGAHNITLLTVRSQFGGGVAFIYAEKVEC